MVSADGEAMTISLSEPTDKVRHQPTERETAALRKWEAEQERRRRAGQWVHDWDKPKIPEWDHVPSGRLVLAIDEGSHWDGLRRKFGDGKRHRVEDLVDAVLVAAATIAAARKASRIEAERQRLREGVGAGVPVAEAARVGQVSARRALVALSWDSAQKN